MAISSMLSANSASYKRAAWCLSTSSKDENENRNGVGQLLVNDDNAENTRLGWHQRERNNKSFISPLDASQESEIHLINSSC